MKNRSLVHLLCVVVLSIILAATQIISISGAFLLVALTAIVLFAIRLERVRYEKRCLAQKSSLECVLDHSIKDFFKQN